MDRAEGPEELSAMFKNMKAEAQAKTEEATPKGPSKFSDYMRKMKTGSRVSEDTLDASLQQNIQLKKLYAEQLDAMQERAWDSLQALDANLKRNTESGLRTSFDKFMEGTSRAPRCLTVAELAKSRAGNFKGKDNPNKKSLQKSFTQGGVVQADDISSDESDMMSPPSPQRLGQPSQKGKLKAKGTSSPEPNKPTSRMDRMLSDIRCTKKNLAQGDVLQDSDALSSADSDKMSNPSPRPSGFGDSARPGANARTKPTPDDSRSLSRVTADQFKSLAEKDPLKKLKKISEQLKLDNARMLSRRAPHAQAIKFSSSGDESDDLDVPCYAYLGNESSAASLMMSCSYMTALRAQSTMASPRAQQHAAIRAASNCLGTPRGYTGRSFPRNPGGYSCSYTPRRFYAEYDDDDYDYDDDYDDDDYDGYDDDDDFHGFFDDLNIGARQCQGYSDIDSD